MSHSPEQRPARVAEWEANTRDLGDEFLAYDREHNRVHVLNTTAREIFMRCDGTRTLTQIGDELAAQFDVDRETALADLAVTIDRLAALGLIEFEG